MRERQSEQFPKLNCYYYYLPVAVLVLQVRLSDTAGRRWLHAHLTPGSTCTNAPFATVSIRKPEEKKIKRNEEKRIKE
jgi:hypothetical protein